MTRLTRLTPEKQLDIADADNQRQQNRTTENKSNMENDSVKMTDDEVGQKGDAEVVNHQTIEPMLRDLPTDLNSGKEPRKRRVLHFSDGIVEEFSDEDEYQVDSAPQKITEPPVDPKTLPWGPWFAHQTVAAGSSVLKVCDYLGETLANLFGITTPKYEYEIEEYKRTIKREKEKKAKDDLEMGGWREPNAEGAPKVEGPIKTDEGDPVAAESLTLLKKVDWYVQFNVCVCLYYSV
ncbi:hypothetical protein B566_EDAN001906 [Ephemera danica]|nr:hypothetical protein B566_EDAN001906 [Ephemera danica]